MWGQPRPAVHRAKLDSLNRSQQSEGITASPEAGNWQLWSYRSHTIPATTAAITRIAPRMYLFFPSHDSEVPNPPLKSKDAGFCGISRAGSTVASASVPSTGLAAA